MLDKKRIEEAQTSIKGYLLDGLLVKNKEFNNKIFQVYVDNSEESLRVAELLSKENTSPLWIIVCSYYSMFYIANAALYKIGYKIGHKIAHKVTADALVVYIKDRLKENIIEEYESASEEALTIANNLIETFDFERAKRSRIQYETTEEIKQSKAKTSLERAKRFVFEINKLLE